MFSGSSPASDQDPFLSHLGGLARFGSQHSYVSLTGGTYLSRRRFPCRSFLNNSNTSETDRLAPGLIFSSCVAEVVLNSQKPSTRRSYRSKWEKYFSYLKVSSLLCSTLQNVLDFLLLLKDSGLSFSSIKVYMSAISAHHLLIKGKTVFSHASSKYFLRGLQNLYLEVRLSPPVWDLPLVLRCLMRL